MSMPCDCEDLSMYHHIFNILGLVILFTISMLEVHGLFDLKRMPASAA